MNLADAVERLESAGIPCALIGGAALAAHGVARATLDVDLLVADPRVLDRSFWPAESRPEIRRGELDDPLIGLVRFETAAGALDLVLVRGAWTQGVVERRRWIELDGDRVPVADAPDLVLLKLAAGGPQDLLDVRMLLASDPAIAPIVEERLGEVPAPIRRVWSELPR